MSTPTPTPTQMTPPYQQWQNFYPAPPTTQEYTDILNAMANQHQHINQNIYQSTDKLTSGINSTSQYLTGGLNNLGKEVTQSSLGLRDAVERGNLVNGNAIERTAGEIKLNTTITDAATRQAASDSVRDILRTVDANGSIHNTNLERIGNTIGNSVERTAGLNMNTTERLGGNIMTAIEKVAGDGRLTTTVTDAASRQAASDNFRDVLGSVDRNGATAVNTTQAIGSTLLSTIERVAGEGRVTTTMVDSASRQAASDSARDVLGAVERNGGANNSLTASVGSNLLAAVERNGGDLREHMSATTTTMNSNVNDARSTIVDGMNRGFNEMLMFGNQNLNQTTKSITDAATEQRAAIWETRTLMNNAAVEQLKAVNVSQLQSSQQYASTMLESQKIASMASLESSNQYSSLLLEQQRMKEYLSSKGDNQFAIGQLEQQKVKEMLSMQAASNYASLLLEQQKSKEILSAQMADAKYDALKNTQFLADKMGECCCEVKQKIDLVDRDRLRDDLIHERDENSIIRAVEFLDRGRGRGRGSRRSRSGSRERR